MERFLIFVTALVLVHQAVAIKAPRHRCLKPFEEYKSCGSACPATCAEPSPMCAEQCTPECQCQSGYVKNAANSCCLPSQCPGTEEPTPRCLKPFAEYKSCGSACPATCAEPSPMCADQCTPGCQCLSGYVEKADGTCCLPAEC